MSSDHAREAIRRLLDGLGLGARAIVFVAKASTCEVWRADTDDGPVAVRVLAPRPDRPGELDADIAIRRLLLSSPGAPVARPLADHRSHPGLAAAPGRPAWTVDRWIEGEPADATIAGSVWCELGALLANLHALPAVDGHGRLAVDGARLAGRRDDADAGIRDRFEAPWPFTGRALGEHPVADAAPEIVARLERLEPAIRAAAEAQPAIVHADLNGANIRHGGGRLRGLIDFADVSALAPAWDFASLRYFHGEAAVGATLGGYTGDSTRAARLTHDARLLALVIALHHVSRARTLDLPHRRATALERLRRGADEIDAH